MGRDATPPVSAVVYTALDQGAFARQGLDVVLLPFMSGKAALQAVLSGEADLATTAETPVMHAGLQGEPVVILSTIAATGKSINILARRDLGIETPADLAGKKIAVTRGTNAEFYLELFLAFVRLKLASVVVVDTPPEAMVVSLQDIVRSAFDLNLLTGEYVHYASPRARTQWQRTHARLTDQLNGVRPTHPDEAALLADVKRIHRDSKSLFNDLDALGRDVAGGGAVDPAAQDLMSRLASQLSTKLLNTVSTGTRLNRVVHERARAARVRQDHIVFGCVRALVVTSGVTSALTMRAVAAPIKQFQEDVRMIGKGDLSHRARVSTRSSWTVCSRCSNGCTDAVCTRAQVSVCRFVGKLRRDTAVALRQEAGTGLRLS